MKLSISQSSLSLFRTAWTTGLVERLGLVIVPLGALLLWVNSVQGLDPLKMDDLGMVSVFSISSYVALALLTISFCLALHQPKIRVSIMLLHVVTLVYMLYGVTTLTQEVPRFHVAWRHVGIVEFITRTEIVNPRLNAYYSWPGFFILSGMITQISGFASSLSLTHWAPFIQNLMYMGPLIMILRSATSNKHLIWLGVWFYFLNNWVGQDYFAPQALNFYFYLVIIAIMVQWFKVTPAKPGEPQERWLMFGALHRMQQVVAKRAAATGRRGWRWVGQGLQGIDNWLAPTDATGETLQPWQRAGLLTLAVLLYVVIVPSHQITPMFVILSVGGLVLLNRCRAHALPILMVIIVMTWISFMTTAYLSGHMHKVVGGVGEVSKNVGTTLTNRVKGSPEHIFVVRMRMVMTAAVGVLGLMGAFRRWRQGHRDLTYIVLMGSPFIMVLVQPYGGEMLLRSYFFALPAMVLFAAALFYPSLSVEPSWRLTGATMAACFLLLTGFLFTRYGNERMDFYTHYEVDAANVLYDIAEPGSLLISGSENLPWKHRDYEKFRHATMTRDVGNNDVGAVITAMDNKAYRNSYLILTRSQQAFAELYKGFAPGAWATFERSLIETGRFEIVYENRDAKIFRLIKSEQASDPQPKNVSAQQGPANH